jgi:site-specific DNA-methyltransferase (adenine-specific)
MRDYDSEGQLGQEPSAEAYVTKLVEVFREVARVLRTDGTVWLNLGDPYVTEDQILSGRSQTHNPRKYETDLRPHTSTCFC